MQHAQQMSSSSSFSLMFLTFSFASRISSANKTCHNCQVVSHNTVYRNFVEILYVHILTRQNPDCPSDRWAVKVDGIEDVVHFDSEHCVSHGNKH